MTTEPNSPDIGATLLSLVAATFVEPETAMVSFITWCDEHRFMIEASSARESQRPAPGADVEADQTLPALPVRPA